MTSPAPGSPAHAWRMRLRTEWLPSIPKGDEYKALKNLRHFLSCLADFGDKDGKNLGKKVVGTVLLAANLGCDRETIKILYLAAEATGLIQLRRTATGQVRGYVLNTLFPPGQVPDWDVALEILATDRRRVHARDGKTEAAKKRPAPPKTQRKKAPADLRERDGLPSRDSKPAEELLPSGDSKTETAEDALLPSRDDSVCRHVTSDLPSRDGTTRLTMDLNHEMAGVSTTATHPGGEGRPGEAFEFVLIGQQRDTDTTPQPAPTEEQAQQQQQEAGFPELDAAESIHDLCDSIREQMRSTRRSA